MAAESRRAREKRRLPLTACDRCGRPGYYDIELNRRCGQIVTGKQCRGRIRLAARSDWTECPSCNGTGWNETACTRCEGVGWFFTRS
jgi:primosomal protein N'